MLPIDRRKVDRSFVVALNRRPENVEIVRAVVTLGRSLGRKIVAEGVETSEQLELLRSLGVGFGQGYLFSRSPGAAEVEEMLRLSTHGPPAAQPLPLAA